MRNISAAFAIITFLSFFPLDALASESNPTLYFRPYVGVDALYVKGHYIRSVDYLFDTSFRGMNLHAGARIHDHLGIEIGYFETGYLKKSNVLNLGIDSKIKLSGYSFEAIGYYPINESGKLELLLSAGIADLAVTSVLSDIKSTTSEIKLRLGGGVQYQIDEHLHLRGTVKYQEGSFSSSVNNFVFGNLGLSYDF